MLDEVIFAENLQIKLYTKLIDAMLTRTFLPLDLPIQQSLVKFAFIQILS